MKKILPWLMVLLLVVVSITAVVLEILLLKQEKQAVRQVAETRLRQETSLSMARRYASNDWYVLAGAENIRGSPQNKIQQGIVRQIVYFPELSDRQKLVFGGNFTGKEALVIIPLLEDLEYYQGNHEQIPFLVNAENFEQIKSGKYDLDFYYIPTGSSLTWEKDLEFCKNVNSIKPECPWAKNHGFGNFAIDPQEYFSSSVSKNSQVILDGKFLVPVSIKLLENE